MGIKQTNGAIVFAGEAAVNVFRARTIASALKLYAKTGMKPNRMYTPTNMLATASQITGKTFKRGQYLIAASELENWIEEQLKK